uniref:Uncharacterized protein n=1 Tax=Halimeda discoidea TaxID=118222 RepID=A0A1C9JB75_9CHLO|nr:hypothetical protein [Halimeda discoidea]
MLEFQNSLVFSEGKLLGLHCKGFVWNGLNNYVFLRSSDGAGYVFLRSSDGAGAEWGTVGEIIVLSESLIACPLFRKNGRVAKYISKMLYKYLKQLYFHRRLTTRESVFLSTNSNFFKFKGSLREPNIEKMHKFIDYIYDSSFFRDCQNSR